MDEVVLSREAYQKIKEELDFLKNVRRPAISEAIKEARAHGDLSENAEYHAAREEQGMIEARIKLLEAKIGKATILDDEKVPLDRITIGCRIFLENLLTGEEINYSLVDPVEVAPDLNRISVKSPIGRGLLGKKVDEKVVVKTPKGTLQFKVLKIERL